MIYEIVHRTAYRYSAPVSQSQHLIHLAPRDMPRQTIHRHSLLIEPAPNTRTDRIDAFGNPVSILEIENEHFELVMHARSAVEVTARAELALDIGMPWEQLRSSVTQPRNCVDLDAAQYAVASPATIASQDIFAYAQASFTTDRPALAAVWDLTRRIYTDFTFDAAATDVATPVSQVFARRRGVCQDFAHLALTCCRAFGMPVRYVSGYLVTRPPEGTKKLQGADASHAWVSLWTPDTGWVDFDPTNNLIPDLEHIAFAVGREYRDIAPITGILVGGGHHIVDVGVDVIPIVV